MATLSATAWRTALKSSSPPSELLSLPVAPRARQEILKTDAHGFAPNLKLIDWLSPVWPVPPSVASRPTAAGREPFKL